MLNFKELNLNPIIVENLEKKGYISPTDIQIQAIPHLLEGKDLLGIAQTGTGKTAAFSLPILDKLARDPISLKANQVRVLILAPTRELASQISDNIENYGKGFNLKYAVIFGGVNDVNQIKALKNGLDILVATPGRLLDLSSQGFVNFSQVEIFVLDEADRMLDMGFITDIKKIIAKLPQKKQSLMFSATMPEAISGLANSILKNAVKVEVTAESTTVEKINQKIYLVDKSNKLPLLLDIVIKDEVVACLVFCKTKHQANRVVVYLQKYDVKAAAIHGNKSQPAREKALNSFREGKIKILVATDIAARGIDIPSITHIINFDIPIDKESYVHRIGRTARAGRDGEAISFCDVSENHYLKAIEKSIRMKIPVDNSHAFFEKPPTQDHSEGRILSRGNKTERSSDKNNSSNNIRSSSNQFGKIISRSENSHNKKSDFSTSRNSDKRNYQKSNDYNQRDYGNKNRRDEENNFAKNDRSEHRFKNEGSKNRSRSFNDSEREFFKAKSSSKDSAKYPARNSSGTFLKPFSKNSSKNNSSNNSSFFKSDKKKFSNNYSPSFSVEDEPLAKKILRKFGFGKTSQTSEKNRFFNQENSRDYSSKSPFKGGRDSTRRTFSNQNKSSGNSSRTKSSFGFNNGNRKPR
jgi:ATP-dependent RNA helicase RhlE